MEISDKLYQLVAENEIDKAIEIAENHLKSLPKTDFHKIIGKNLLHLTNNLTNYISEFYNNYKNEFDFKAIYSEMNGFSINYDLWFIDLFGFDKCEGLEDLDWLGDYDYSTENSLKITGFEDLQNVYQDYMENEKYNDKELEKVCEVCELLIILRLQELFRESKKIAIEKKLDWSEIPIFATAHDYEMIYEVNP